MHFAYFLHDFIAILSENFKQALRRYSLYVANRGKMKKTLMLISGKSKHFLEVRDFLCHSQIDVVHIDNVNDVRAGLKIHSPAFVLLDFGIKGSDFLLGEIAFGQHAPHPYIMVAEVYTNGNDRAAMLKRGADHCVDTPINVHEILAVMDSVLRRSKQLHVIKYKDMTINKSCRAVTMRGEPVPLTRKEYQVLSLLADHAGTILTKEEIYRAVWNSEYDPKSTNISDQIYSLRCKLGLSSKGTDYIRTVIGVGYCFGDTI